jgi:hypothetical protein
MGYFINHKKLLPLQDLGLFIVQKFLVAFRSIIVHTVKLGYNEQKIYLVGSGHFHCDYPSYEQNPVITNRTRL